MAFSLDNIAAIEAHLSKSPYLSEGGLPGGADAQIYLALNKGNYPLILEVPDVAKYPNFHHWYYFINSFSNDLMKGWAEKMPKVEQKKKVEDDDDLFGDDDSTPPPPVPKP